MKIYSKSSIFLIFILLIILLSTCKVGDDEVIVVEEASEETASNSCEFNGQTVSDNDSVTAYQAATATVAFGNTCQSETRTCSDGTLSGSYAYSSCSVLAASDCSFNNATVSHNTSVTAYQAATVAFGNTCQSETRTCSDGTLSDSYAYSSCSVLAPSDCSFNNATVSHNTSVTAYQAATVAFGNTCQSETRTCSDGTLSGSYAYSSCSVSEYDGWNKYTGSGDGSISSLTDNTYGIGSISVEMATPNKALLVTGGNKQVANSIRIYEVTWNSNYDLSINYRESMNFENIQYGMIARPTTEYRIGNQQIVIDVKRLHSEVNQNGYILVAIIQEGLGGGTHRMNYSIFSTNATNDSLSTLYNGYENQWWFYAN